MKLRLAWPWLAGWLAGPQSSPKPPPSAPVAMHGGLSGATFTLMTNHRPYYIVDIDIMATAPHISPP